MQINTEKWGEKIKANQRDIVVKIDRKRKRFLYKEFDPTDDNLKEFKKLYSHETLK